MVENPASVPVFAVCISVGADTQTQGTTPTPKQGKRKAAAKLSTAKHTSKHQSARGDPANSDSALQVQAIAPAKTDPAI